MGLDFCSKFKKKVLFIVSLNFMFLGMFNFSVKATRNQSINVPYVYQQYGNYTILDKTNKHVIENTIKVNRRVMKETLTAQINFEDNFLEILFNYNENLKEDEIYFATIVDKQKGVVDRAFLLNNEYAKFLVPYHSDTLEVFIYKQKKSDCVFKENDENLIGKTKIFLPHEENYKRPNGSFNLTKINVKGDSIAGEENTFLVRTIPNHYTIMTKLPLSDFNNFRAKDKKNSNVKYNIEDNSVIKDYSDLGYIGVIVLKDSQKDLLKPEEKFIPISYYNVEGENEKIVFTHSFYIPKDITEFDFYIYRSNVEYNDLRRIYKIKLNRQ